MTLASGTRLGAYEVAAQIGAGGMGEVYQAHDTKLGRDVVISWLLGYRKRYGSPLPRSNIL
jgi:serine/threonine protein kinase